MSKLVTIIVPVYNMEGYLNKCVDSLLAQSYTNLEIILVDDGSTDSSLSICDRYASKDARVRAIHKQNGGLSDARNAGLNIMRGEYVAFVDADDFLEIDAIKIMVETIQSEKAKIAHIRSNIIGADYQLLYSQSKNTFAKSKYSSTEYIEGMCKKIKSESVCDKLFVADLYKDRRFEKGRLNEDFYFLSKILFEDFEIVEIDFAGYNYYQRLGSISHSGFGKSLVDSVKNCYELKQLAKEDKQVIEKYFAYLALFQARTALLTMPFYLVKQNSVEYKEILRYMRECLPFLNESYLSKWDKRFLRLVDKMPRLTLRITSILWKIKSKRK